MADYASDISTDDYIYTREISITETGGEDRVNFPVKFTLNSSNFNFELARSDGLDFRLGEGSNGTYILNMWIATWDTTNRIVTIWFKMPSLLSEETKILYTFWGNATSSGISDIDSVDFLFADGFDGSSLDPTKWVYSSINSVSNSKVRINTDGYMEAQGTPLSGITNWVVEEGVYVAAGSDSTYHAYRPRFYGTENNFGYNYYVEGDYDRQSNLVNSSTWVTYNGTQKGLESDSYSENFIAYIESTDKVYQSMVNRSSYVDYTDSLERKVYGDTRITYFRIYGRNNSAAPYVDIDWIVVREFFLIDPYSFDTSNLFVTWEEINHESISWIDYGSDLTSTDYYHYSSYGGDPYQLSDNNTGSTTDCWYSDSNTVVSGVNLIIDFGRKSNLVSSDYIHYDSGHVGWNNASKLSDSDEDIWGNTYFQGTTTSGYICIDFEPDNVAVGCLSVKAHTTASGMVKNFIFKGSYKDPRLSTDDEWDVLYTGTFENISDWQPIYIANGTPYRYYKLDVLDTYGDKPITLQEWEMYEYFPARRKMIVSQIRLRPITLGSDEIYFPKQISLEGSNELNDWDTLIPTTNTYTPFYDYVWERWQRYSFTNTKGYYCYKITCSGNWNNYEDRMGISEWEMVERVDESYKYRVLSGSSNDFSAIWGNDDLTFSEGFLYISNDVLNIVYNDRLVRSETVSGTIMDLNVL